MCVGPWGQHQIVTSPTLPAPGIWVVTYSVAEPGLESSSKRVWASPHELVLNVRSSSACVEGCLLCVRSPDSHRNSLPLAQAGPSAPSHLNRLGRLHNVSHGRRKGRRKCDIGTLPSALGPPSETSCLTATCLVSLCLLCT
uniref:Uncharacterized protein n=1 Tax=Myotis myotis TaxID=51298 RepID=A0A7J7WI21_MYOMY|nr:hypothetical protein mMyoMyo1_012083 [Myotis myotis]